MPMWARSIGKAPVWVLVLLAPVQPVLAIDCSCCCRIADTATKPRSCQRTECPCEKPAACSHRHVEPSAAATGVQGNHEQSSEHEGARRPAGSCPCSCPQDCGCHLRHATRLGILSSPATQVINHSGCASVGAIIPRLLIGIDEQLATKRHQNFFCETSALAICALLCRFSS